VYRSKSGNLLNHSYFVFVGNMAHKYYYYDHAIGDWSWSITHKKNIIFKYTHTSRQTLQQIRKTTDFESVIHIGITTAKLQSVEVLLQFIMLQHSWFTTTKSRHNTVSKTQWHIALIQHQNMHNISTQDIIHYGIKFSYLPVVLL